MATLTSFGYDPLGRLGTVANGPEEFAYAQLANTRQVLNTAFEHSGVTLMKSASRGAIARYPTPQSYRDDRDRTHFCELLAETVDRFGLRLHACVLMSNHYHLVLETPQVNLSRAMQWLNVSYSLWFSRRHDRSGHSFHGRPQHPLRLGHFNLRRRTLFRNSSR